MNPSISILIPVFNEEQTLGELAGQIKSVLDSLGKSFEILFIDDGSTDQSWPVIRELSDGDACIKGLRLRRNFGKATALALASSRAVGEMILTLDADLQDDPREIPNFLRKLDEGYDLVSGWKENRRDPVSKTLPSRFFNKITRMLTGIPLRDFNCGFKAARAEVYRNIALYGELHRYIPVLAHNQGYKIGEVAVLHHPRKAGQSKYGFERYARGFLDLLTVLLITRYGRRPSHLFGGVGIILGLAGSLALLYLTGIWLFGDAPIGNRPLLFLGILLVILSVQLLSLGLLAELILNRTEDRRLTPLIAEERGFATDPPSLRLC
jgi:dolichol-phosphate mannosyltransferase